jgi:hypothetical protein
MNDTNAGPVLPEHPSIRGFCSWDFDYLQNKFDAYGLQCWNACDEQVAGPLREALSECAKAVGAGASPDCSVEFLREVPREVELFVAKLRERVAELESEVSEQDYVIGKTTGLLAETVLILRGPEPPLTKWSHHDIPKLVQDLSIDRDRLRAENEALRRFAQRVMKVWPEGSLDAPELQDLAETCGLLRPVEIAEPCGDDCNCANYGVPFPAYCYRTTELLYPDAARAAREG